MQVASGSHRGTMEEALLLHPMQSGEQRPIPPGQQITALPAAHTFRESSSSTVITSRTRAHGRAFSHNPHVSTSSNLSYGPLSHRRRGSTLKIVMRKIFGKRRQSNLEDDEVIERTPAHRDQTVDFARRSNQMLFETKQPYDSSVGLYTYNRKRPLVASNHSSVSSDQIALSSQGKRIEVPNQVIRRRATLPSLILTEDDDTKQSVFSAAEEAAASTRPASVISESHGDHEKSKSQHTLKTHRRSRSADALQNLARRHRMSPIQWRRRSDEIKFWRTSILGIDQHDTEAEQIQTNIPDTPAATSSDFEVLDNGNGNSNGTDNTPKSEPATAPFHLESLLANMADPDATVEQRLTTLEVKLMDLEFAISNIQGTDNKPTANEDKVDKDVSNDPPYFASQNSSQSSLSFGGSDRPISTSTLRPNMVYAQPTPWQGSSWSSSMNLNGISIEQYSALVTLVRREQTARKALESQVAQLQEEMQQIRCTSVLPASPPGTLYPIPSPDSDQARFRNRCSSPSRNDSNTSGDAKRLRENSKYRLTREKGSRYVSNMI